MFKYFLILFFSFSASYANDMTITFKSDQSLSGGDKTFLGIYLKLADERFSEWKPTYEFLNMSIYPGVLNSNSRSLDDFLTQSRGLKIRTNFKNLMEMQDNLKISVKCEEIKQERRTKNILVNEEVMDFIICPEREVNCDLSNPQYTDEVNLEEQPKVRLVLGLSEQNTLTCKVVYLPGKNDDL